MALITIFTAPKPFINPHICMIQKNAILSWKNLGSDVEVFLVGNEPGIAETAAELGVRFLPVVRRNAYGTPLVSSIFQVACESSSSPLMAYLNADILAMSDMVAGAVCISKKFKRFLAIGQRLDLNVRQSIDFSRDWESWLKEQLEQRGRPHPPSGSDYFIYPRDCFTALPDFAIGRVGWDNWAIYYARHEGMAVVDASKAIKAIHQDHDYSHLPGGKPSYHSPEADQNVDFAGGKRDMFTQQDANYFLEAGHLHRSPMTWQRFWREVEIFPIISLHSPFLGQLFFGVFHPIKAYDEFRAWLKRKLQLKAEK